MTNPMASPPFPPTDDNLELLTELLLALDQVSHVYAWLVMHFEGAGPLAYLAPEARAALGNRFDRFNINLARLTVTSIAERLRLSGWGGADGDAAQVIWQRDDMDVRIRQAFNEALLLGRSELFVWPQNGLARISVESAQQTAVLGNPGTRCPTSAVKRWRTRATTESLLLTPDVIQHYQASAGATVGGFQLIDEQPNPLGEVPVASLVNADRLPLYWGVTSLTEFAYPERGPFMGGSVRSEVWDVIPIAQAITKILMDMLVTSERLARPARWATGIELVERPRIDPSGQPVVDSDGNPVIQTVSPIDLTDMTITAEAADAKVGQLEGASLDSYSKAVSVLVSMLQAVAALPAHYLGQLQNQVPSADGLRAAEASLVAKVEEKQLAFGLGLRRAMQLAIACETGRDPRSVDVNPQWCDASNASMAQEADAVVKLHAANLLPTSFALRKLGYSEAEIEQARQDMTADVAAQKAGDPLAQYMSRANPQLY
jgi:Phage portal protein, SPP1 Gp6-like